jgi:ribosomal protein S18 acetylase RimI-like enzyme
MTGITVNSQLTIEPLSVNFLVEVIRIHQAVLGYTLNSQLGDAHLTFIYQQMAHDLHSFVGVARLNGQPVGVVSGTVDPEKLKKRFLKSMRPKLALNLLFRLIQNPGLLREFHKGDQIGSLVKVDGQPIQAILTTIAVDPRFQGRGIGAGLVSALEVFFRERGIEFYRLDTLISNHSARTFYQKLGFEEFETRADSVIYIKGLKHA